MALFDLVASSKDICLTENKEHFFGYYDKCPWNLSGRYVLSHEISFGDRIPSENDSAVLGLIDLTAKNRFEPIAKTLAWCWQQGAMLQWHPGQPENKIIYNDRRDGQFVAVVLNIQSGHEQVLPRPVAAVSRDGKKALSLNFSRLADERTGYGYTGLTDPYAGHDASDEDGIYLIDMETGKCKLIISLARLAEFDSLLPTIGTKNWVNHLLFSCDNNRFVFLHRWRRNRSVYSTPTTFVTHFTRMFTANIDGSDIYCLNDHDMTSHVDWRNKDQVLAFAHQFEVGNKYFLFADKSDEVDIVGDEKLTPFYDGHCSYSPNGQWILTDTYPDKNLQQTLLLYNPEKDILVNLGSYHSKEWGFDHLRCDLHPCWSRDGKQICFDSSHSGSRQVYIMDISDVIEGC